MLSDVITTIQVNKELVKLRTYASGRFGGLQALRESLFCPLSAAPPPTAGRKR
jgi:hypothetical protein